MIMSEAQGIVLKSSRRRRWPRRVAGIFVVLILLLVVGWFMSPVRPFSKRHSAKGGEALNAKITVDDASISPFSQIT